MNGEQTITELKKISGFCTPIIALTADAVADAKEKYIKEGFIDYIAKPFSKNQIKEKLDNIFVIDQNINVEEQKKESIDWDSVPIFVIGSDNNSDIELS